MAAKKDDFSVKKIYPKLGGERGTRNPNGPTSSHDLVEQMEFLYVHVNEFINNSATYPVVSPIVEITLGNYKSSTKTLSIDGNKWNQVFAFDKSQGDVLFVTLKVGQTVIGKQNFKLSADIPTRVPPDARLASRWYRMKNTETGHDMGLLMSVWFGTQADEVYSQAWFSDAYDVSASCVINTRSQIYVAPKLCYVRLTIVSGHDLISNDRRRAPSVYVKAILGHVLLKTEIVSGSNPSWNKDLIFVASEPLDDIVYFEIMDRVDEQHEECIGRLERKLTEMTPLKEPGLGTALFYDIEPSVKVNPAGDMRRFTSRLKMKLSTDQSYHVFDECSQYSSDYRAYATKLWPQKLGKLEIGILSAKGLTSTKEWRDGYKSTDAYVVAKYGNKWARTRTVVNNASPKWNEQYSWDVYDKCTVITLGIYDNYQFVQSNMQDVPIGKVRIPLKLLQWDKVYSYSWPILVLDRDGLKKHGEIQLAVRCASPDEKTRTWVIAPFFWMLPKSHYKFPLSLLQIETLRVQAVHVNCLNLAKTEPPLRNEVVMDMLKPKNMNFSMRKTKANFQRAAKFATKVLFCYDWIHTNIISTAPCPPKIAAFFVCVLLICYPGQILWYGCSFLCGEAAVRHLCRLAKFVNREYLRNMFGTDTPTPLILIDLKLSQLDSPNLDELDEEFDTFPSSETNIHVLRMRYDRLRIMSANVMTLIGDFASQGERLITFFQGDELASIYFLLGLAIVLFAVLFIHYKFLLCVLVFYWLIIRNDLPAGIKNFFRRMPTNEDVML